MAKVLCGAPCAKFPTYAEFYDSFSSVVLPEGSLHMRATGGSIPKNLNLLVQTMFDNDCSHLFVVEDDSSFAPDTVTRLLAHDVPVVAGMCRQRQAPFRPYLYSGFDPVTGLKFRPLLPTDKGLIGPNDGLIATGMGGILIKREVFEKLEKPWFQHFFEGETEWGQDIMFGSSLAVAGIPVYCDLDVVIWHATQAVIGTKFEKDVWATVVRVNDADITMFTA